MKFDLRRSLFLLLAATLGLTQGTASPLPASMAASKPNASASGANPGLLRAGFLVLGVKSEASGARSLAFGAKSSVDDLQAVLAQMDAGAADFTSLQGEFEFKQYQKVVDDMFVQKGIFYFRRTKMGVEAAFQFTSPDDKQVIFKDGKLSIYDRKINQITETDVRKNKTALEAFLSLGFGGRSEDLLKDYEVQLEGWENIDGAKTAKLGLVAKNERVRNTYNKIVLWIDPARDVSLQQQFFEGAGNYRLTHYTNLKTNGKLPSDAFKLKTSPHPKTVKPQE